MDTSSFDVVTDDRGLLRLTGVLEWQHRPEGDAHSLLRASFAPQTGRVVAVVSELASNPDNRGALGDFGSVADAALAVFRRFFGSGVTQAIWVAHVGPFSYYDPTGPEEYLQVPLKARGDRYVDDMKDDVRLTPETVAELVGEWVLEPVPSVLARLGRES